MSDISHYLLWQQQSQLNSIESKVDEQAETLDHVAEQVEEITSWLKRLAIAATLWGASAGVTMSGDQLADLIVALLKK